MPIFKAAENKKCGGKGGFKTSPKATLAYITRPGKAAVVSSFYLDDNKNYADQFAQTAKIWNKAQDKNSRKFYHFIVNNYNAEIDNRVHKIIKRKTRFQKFADRLDHSISCINALMFFAPFLYGLAVTILAIFRNPPVRNDFISAGKAIGNVFVKMFCGLKWLVLKAAGLSEFVPNPTAEKILWWVILILAILITAALVLAVIFFVGFFIYCFYQKYDYEISKAFDKIFLAAALADLGAVTFCGDRIKNVIPINLVLTYLILLAIFLILKIAVPIIIEKARR